MALVDAYITVSDLTDHLSSMGEASGENTELIERAINASSRAVDEYCRRRFTTDTTATARVFQAEDSRMVWCDDFHTTTDLVIKTDTTDDGTYDTIWTSSDYELDPLNGRSSTGEAWPYSTVHAVESRTFPLVGRRRGRVEITAQWGWASVPVAIQQATLLVAARVYRRRSSPEGVVGFGDFGQIRVSNRMDPDAVMMMHPYVKVGVLR